MHMRMSDTDIHCRKFYLIPARCYDTVSLLDAIVNSYPIMEMKTCLDDTFFKRLAFYLNEDHLLNILIINSLFRNA